MRDPRHWTPEDLAWARDMIGRPGWTLPLVAEKLGRTPNALKIKLTRTKTPRPATGRTAGTLRLRDVMQVLGLGGNHDRVRGWINSKLLTAHRVPVAGRRPIYAIYPADLAEFLQSHPEAYEAFRVPVLVDGRPNPYRQFVRHYDPTAGYLSRKQAARALGVAPSTLKRWTREGRITAVRLRGLDIHPLDAFYAIPEIEAALARRVRLRNGWWTLPLPEERRAA